LKSSFVSSPADAKSWKADLLSSFSSVMIRGSNFFLSFFPTLFLNLAPSSRSNQHYLLLPSMDPHVSLSFRNQSLVRSLTFTSAPLLSALLWSPSFRSSPSSRSRRVRPAFDTSHGSRMLNARNRFPSSPGELSTAVAFTALSLFTMLRGPLNMIPMFVVSILQTHVAM